MAITNAQQFKQLVNPPMKGKKRPGYRGPGGYQGGRKDTAPGAAKAGPVERPGSADNRREQYAVTGNLRDVKSEKQLGREAEFDKFKYTRPEVNVPGLFGRLLKKPIQKFADFSARKNRAFFEDVIRAGKIPGLSFDMTQQELEKAYDDYMSARLSGEIDAFGNPLNQGDDSSPLLRTGIMAQAPKEDEEEDPFFPNFRLMADGGRVGLQEGGGIEQRLEQLGGDVTSAEQMLQGINQRLKTAESSLGSGGGIGGLPGAGGPKIDEAFNPMQTPPGMFPAGPPQGFSSFEEMMKFRTTQDVPNFFYDLEGVRRDPQGNLFTPKPGQLPTTITRPRPEIGAINFLQSPQQDPYKGTQLAGLSQDGQRFDSAQSAFDALAEQTRKIREFHRGRDMVGTELFQGAEGFKRFTDMFNKINDPSYVAPSPQLLSAQGSLGIPAAGYADGGLADIARQELFLGGVADTIGKGLKKATRAIKKIAKSPIGKAALLYAGGSFLSGKGIFGSLQPSFLKNMSVNKALMQAGSSDYQGGATSIFDLIPGGKTGAAILGTSIAAGLTTPKEDKTKTTDLGPDIDDPELIMRYPELYRNFRQFAEGGSTDKEPVAKKTMPLLDMGGKEMDLREEGGFVPIGRMEKADDVPARLSKNEFVFTADAVRNAGDGDVDKGAEVMYNMMKNLEAGGEVSEESQGLEGARKMFQTSQRLGEVL